MHSTTCRRRFSNPAAFPSTAKANQTAIRAGRAAGSATMKSWPARDMVRVAIERPDQPEAVALIDELDAFQKPLYPPESHHGIDIAALLQPHVIFAVARCAHGEAVGCGAVVVEDGWGELKRMFVRPAMRGQGVARSILSFLEAQANLRGVRVLRLE